MYKLYDENWLELLLRTSASNETTFSKRKQWDVLLTSWYEVVSIFGVATEIDFFDFGLFFLGV